MGLFVFIVHPLSYGHPCSSLKVRGLLKSIGSLDIVGLLPLASSLFPHGLLQANGSLSFPGMLYVYGSLLDIGLLT